MRRDLTTRSIILASRHETVATNDTRCYFNVRSKADISQLNLPHCCEAVCYKKLCCLKRSARRAANCCTTVKTRCRNPPQIDRIDGSYSIRAYGRPPCNKLFASSHDTSTVVYRRGQQTRPSTSFVDNMIELLWRNFPKSCQSLGHSSRGNYSYFGGTGISLKHRAG